MKNLTFLQTVSNPFHIVCPILIVGGIIQSILLLCHSDALKRSHPPDDPDGAKRLKPDDTSGGYLFLPALVLNLPLPLLKDSDNISEGLTYLWKSAWGKNSEATLFETRQVDRDGTLPGVCTPKTCTVLNVPGTILKPIFISAILIRQEYGTALQFAILIARGGQPSPFKDHRKNRSVTPEVDEPLPESEHDSAVQLNPFISPDEPDPDKAGAVAYVGHPGIGM